MEANVTGGCRGRAAYQAFIVKVVSISVYRDLKDWIERDESIPVLSEPGER